MKKTILTAAACLLIISAVMAETETTNFNVEATENVEKVELSSFCKAIVEGDIDTVKRMIDLGEDVNKKSLGKTPAIFAARYNKGEILKLLIANDADLTRKCDRGWTIVKHAKLSNATEVLAILQENI
jgi:ankyrin repeat protein